MKTGAFIQSIAEAFGVAEPTAKQVVRELKDATPSLFSSGLRGRYSPDVTPQDAAHVIIAILGTDRPSKSVETVKDFREITLDNEHGDVPSRLAELEFAPTLAEFIEGLLTFQPWSMLPGIYQIELKAEDRAAEVRYFSRENGKTKLHHITFSQGYETGEAALAAAKVDRDRKIIRTGRSVFVSQITEVAIALKHD